MNRIITICAAVLMTASMFAQSPEKMSYQAVVRDGSDALVTSAAVGMQISILQGTANGNAVYVETQTPTANANGLVSLEIGIGTTSDDFSTIDWSDGPYFIKTETDPKGGTSYSITGTSQLMSVPYALYAKSAETVTDGITETDPVFTAWDKSTGISITESQITDLGTYIETETDPTVTKYSVGDFAHGGVVFAVDESGQHGLVCAIEDQSSGIPWSPDVNIFTKARGNGIYAGKSNTIIIISVTTANYEPIWWDDDYAALICADYNGNGFSDWYLPSKIELQLMYLNRDRINENAVENEGKIFETNNWYWSSTEQEGSGFRAWAQKFSNSFEVEEFDKREIFNVRAVRAF